MPVKHAASSKYMVSHFAERLEHMNHQTDPPFLKNILMSNPVSARGRSASCLVFVVHSEKVCHVKSVFAQVC